MAKRFKSNRNQTVKSYGMGMPLILVIYVTLCLVTLSVISLMTSRQSYHNEQASTENLTSYTTAENEAEQWIHELKTSETTKMQQVYEKDIPITEGKTLVVEVEFYEVDGEVTYEIHSWHVETEESDQEQTVQGL